jgi:hypothetical protein
LLLTKLKTYIKVRNGIYDRNGFIAR